MFTTHLLSLQTYYVRRSITTVVTVEKRPLLLGVFTKLIEIMTESSISLENGKTEKTVTI